MMYPLVLDLAADGVPVAVTCRMLGLSKQAFYQWKASEFGYRFITDEPTTAGWQVSRNRVGRLCTQQQLWSVHARRRGRHRRPGPPVHDDLVRREFTAARPNQLWLTARPGSPQGGRSHLPITRLAALPAVPGAAVPP